MQTRLFAILPILISLAGACILDLFDIDTHVRDSTVDSGSKHLKSNLKV